MLLLGTVKPCRLRKKSFCPPRRTLHPRPVEFSLRETAGPIQQGESLQRTDIRLKALA
jgi:hypothetical protein